MDRGAHDLGGTQRRAGTMPVALALSPQGDRLLVAESGADVIAVIRLPSRLTKPALNWTLVAPSRRLTLPSL